MSMLSASDEDDFDFDCPKTVVNIPVSSAERGESVDSGAIDEWFLLPHPRHKKQSTPVTDRKRSSICGGVVESEENEDVTMSRKGVVVGGASSTSASTAARSKRIKSSISSLSTPTSTSTSSSGPTPGRNLSRAKSDVTKSTASSIARRRSVDVCSSSSQPQPKPKPVLSTKKKQGAPDIKRAARANNSSSVTQVDTAPPAPVPPSPPRKVSVEIKSFAVPANIANNTKKKDTAAAGASLSSGAGVALTRAAKLEEYRRQKQQQCVVTQHQTSQSEASANNQKRKSVSGRLAAEPPIKKHQVELNEAAVAKRPGSRKGGMEKENQKDNAERDMLDLLKQHNKKFQQASLYEPSRHSVRDVRRWERATGQTWSSLKPDERERANSEILKLKESS